MSVRFQGFRAGSQVTMDAVTTSAWGQVVSNSIFDATATPGVSVSIAETRGDFQTAPEHIEFNMTMSGFDTNPPGSGYDVTFRDKHVYWRCRSHQYDFTAPAPIISMDAADGGNRAAADHGIGRVWDFVAQVPGTYIFDVVVHEPSSGKIGKDTVTLTVLDQEDEFPGTQTIFVSTTGVYDNAPPGAQTTTNINSAISTMLAAETTKHQVMLERGQTHIVTSDIDIKPSAGAALSCFRMVAREGAGAAPIVVDNAGGAFRSSFITENSHNLPSTEIPAEFVLSGIEFVGDFDVTDGTGVAKIFCTANINQRSGNYLLLNNLTIRGFDRAMNADGSTSHPNRMICFCNSIITDWASNGFFGGNGSRLSFIGCDFYQNDAAIFSLSGGPGGSPSSNIPASPITTTSGWCGRVTTCTRLFMQSCGSCPKQGWSTWGSTQPAGQAAWRLFASVGSAWVPTVITYCVMEGLRFCCYFRPTNGGEGRQPCNGLFEKNFLIGGFQAADVIELEKGGMNIRHCQFVSAGVKNATPEGGQNVSANSGIALPNNSGASLNGNDTTPISIEHVTVVNLSTSNMGNREVHNQRGMNVSTSDMLFYQPNGGSPDTADGPFETVQGFTPRFLGVLLNDFSTRQPVSATPLAAGVIYTKADKTGAIIKPDYSVPA